MKKTQLILLALLAVIAAGCNGCATRAARWYGEQDWTPESMDVTQSFDTHGGGTSDTYIGFGWNLKPHRGEK